MRFTEDELELLDATAEYLLEKNKVNYSRTAVVRWLLGRAQPPDSLGPAARYRLAYKRVFPGAGDRREAS
jgi:hypothetical protein